MQNFARSSWNPSIGCSKVSPGCLNCYAQNIATRLQKQGNATYKDGFLFKILPERLKIPLKTKKPTLFFVNSMSDIFHENMPFDFLDEILKIIAKTPNHQYQMLTKRPKIMAKYFKNRQIPKNLWLGVTIESEHFASRLEILKNLDAFVRWISFEPLLSSVKGIDLSGISWACVGAESGARARKINPIWVREILSQCRKSGTSLYFHGWGDSGVICDGFDDFKEYPKIFMPKTSLFDF
ncbi:DUF5131 family protein [Campylobacter mucosalis]|uniref:DUF5131 family protein n=1 Tax=Campylobacter mucosalis TaxID=202 RepID=UPI00146FCA62|nr:DUF5131 family protein [Campylobacter mucosalis]